MGYHSEFEFNQMDQRFCEAEDRRKERKMKTEESRAAVSGHTPGPWNWAVDSYGKVQHSRKYDCVYTNIRGKNGDRLQTIAARIENTHDARLIAAAPEMAEALMDLLISDPKHFSPKARVALAKAGLI